MATRWALGRLGAVVRVPRASLLAPGCLQAAGLGLRELLACPQHRPRQAQAAGLAAGRVLVGPGPLVVAPRQPQLAPGCLQAAGLGLRELLGCPSHAYGWHRPLAWPPGPGWRRYCVGTSSPAHGLGRHRPLAWPPGPGARRWYLLPCAW